MDAKEQINTWLKDPNRSLQDGIKLYNDHGKNNHLKVIYTKGKRPESWLMKSLEYNLAKLSGFTAVVPSDKVVIDTDIIDFNKKGAEIPHVVGNKQIDVSKLPEDLQALYAEIQDIVPKMAIVHQKMKDPDLDDEERRDLAEQLTGLEDVQKGNWELIDKWALENGAVKDETEMKNSGADQAGATVDVDAMKKRLKVVKDGITRAKKDLEKPGISNNTRKKREKTIREYETEQVQLEKDIEAAEDVQQ